MESLVFDAHSSNLLLSRVSIKLSLSLENTKFVFKLATSITLTMAHQLPCQMLLIGQTGYCQFDRLQPLIAWCNPLIISENPNFNRVTGPSRVVLGYADHNPVGGLLARLQPGEVPLDRDYPIHGMRSRRPISRL
jgi:hypothetical protein